MNLKKIEEEEGAQVRWNKIQNKMVEININISRID